jgi:hypothetical protein
MFVSEREIVRLLLDLLISSLTGREDIVLNSKKVALESDNYVSPIISERIIRTDQEQK